MPVLRSVAYFGVGSAKGSLVGDLELFVGGPRRASCVCTQARLHICHPTMRALVYPTLTAIGARKLRSCQR